MPALWMLVASFAFAAMGAAVKLASHYYSTNEIVMYRGLVGVLMLVIIARHQGGTFRTHLRREHLARCTWGVVSLWFWFYAIGALPLATAVTLNYMAPIWIAIYLFLLGLWQRKNHVEWPMIAAIAMSFAGVVMVLQPTVASNQWIGGAAGLLSSVLSAIAYMQVRRLGKMGEPEYRVVFYFSLMSFLAGMVGCFVTGATTKAPSFHAHGWESGALLLALGITACIAQLAMTRSYRFGKVLVVANLQYTGIIFSSLWGMLLWADSFDWRVWLGIVLILVSGVAATFYNSSTTAETKTDPIASET